MQSPKLRFSSPLKRAAPPSPPPPPPDDGHQLRMEFWDHVNDLRKRLTWALLALALGAVVGMMIGTPVMEFLVAPYGSRLQALGPTEPVVAYFRVSLMIGAIIALPMVTYQLLAFILPGLKESERRLILWSLLPVTLLFVVGIAFAWGVLIPAALDFLENFAPTLFKPEWTADLYLSFVTSLVFWMGVAFQTPLIFFVLSVMGVVQAKTLREGWRVAVVASAVIAALITPTVDPVNMALVMGPLLTLYLLSIFLAGFGYRMYQRRTGDV